MARSLSLTVKLPMLVTLVVLGVAATIGAVLVAQERQALQANLDEKALLLARSVALLAPEAMLRHDSWTLYKSIKQIAASLQGDVVSVSVLDAEGRVVADLFPARNPLGLPPVAEEPAERALLDRARSVQRPEVLKGGQDEAAFVEGVVPVTANDKVLGVVRARLSAAMLEARVTESATITLSYALSLAMIGSLAGALWMWHTVRPLRALAHAMETVAAGQAPRLDAAHGDEVGHLVASFNRMTEELEDKRRAAEELARSEKLIALGRIVAGVAHEVNNPLGGMLTCISTLKAHPGEQALIDRYIPVLEKGLHRIRAIVQDLLVNVRTQEVCENCDMTCINEVRDLVAMEISGREIDFRWDVRLDGAPRLHRPCLQQVLLNLLRNGAEAMPEGGMLSLEASRNGQEVVFEVADTGVGIPADDLGHVFDPFFTTKANGTGLGLWIVFRLVQGMKGSITVTSEPGQGSRFRIVLPVEGEARG